MYSVEAGKMSAVDTEQMSAAETGQMSAVETRETGQRPVATVDISVLSQPVLARTGKLIDVC